MSIFITGLPYSGQDQLNDALYYSGNCSMKSKLAEMVYNMIPLVETQTQENALRSFIKNFTGETDYEYSFDTSPHWLSLIPFLSEFMHPKPKFICMVRNPAIIVACNEAAYRKRHQHHPSPMSTIASRAYEFAAPNGPLGSSHALLQDAILMGYSENILFVDYDKLCKAPLAGLDRMRKFVGVNFKYNEVAYKFQYEAINPVEYIGLDLFQQYNREIFWDARV